MKVLLTGAFGNLGCLILKQLLEHGHSVTCFDIKSKVNVKQAKPFLNKVTIHWGDIRDEQTLKAAVKSQGAIIHLAAVIAPFSELNPKFAFDVNVGGTQKLIKVANQQQHKPLIVFASSISVLGNTQQLTPPRKAGDPLEENSLCCER